MQTSIASGKKSITGFNSRQAPRMERRQRLKRRLVIQTRFPLASPIVLDSVPARGGISNSVDYLTGAVSNWKSGSRLIASLRKTFQGQWAAQLQAVSSTRSEKSSEEKQVDRELTAATLAFGLALGSLWFPPLLLMSLPCVLYSTSTVTRDAFNSVVKEGKIRMSVLDTVVIGGMLLTGRLLLLNLTAFLVNGSFKLVMLAQDNASKGAIDIFRNQSREAWVRRDDGIEIAVPVSDLKTGDIVVVHTGESISVDGEVCEGQGSVDQHVLTGESQPVDRGLGESVFASTTLLSGRICVEVKTTGSETVAARIADILNNTADFRSSTQLRGQRLSDKSAIPTLAVGALALPVAGVSGALAVLSSAFGWSMRALGPISVLNFVRLTSDHGILIKDGRSLELMDQLDTVVFDKTGTLTAEVPHVGEVHTIGDLTSDEILAFAAAAEKKQSHPIGRAIVNEARRRGLSIPAIEDATYQVGLGIEVVIDKRRVRVGSARFIDPSEKGFSEEQNRLQNEAHDQGFSLVYVSVDGEIVGGIELRATIRPEARQIIKTLKEQGLSLYIISGDHEKPTRALAAELGIDNYFSETLPQDKAGLIENLQSQGRRVCFIGDGINDSIALKRADVSISMKGASTAAMDTAQIVMMDGSLEQLTRLFGIAKAFERNMKANLALSIAPGLICTAGVFLFHWGLVSAIGFFNIGLLLGIGNSMSPLITHRLRSTKTLEIQGRETSIRKKI